MSQGARSSTAGAQDEDLPVAIITGFLGAGKTTLLNRFLQSSGGQIAVIVNEFGELGVDGRLIPADVPLVELANGCICCVGTQDIRRAIAALVALDRPIKGIVIETSGLADPEPVLAFLDASRRAGAPLLIASVVCLIDADQFNENLQNAQVAYQQIVTSDLLVINKCDLVTPAVADGIERALAMLNPAAACIRTTEAEIPPEAFFPAQPYRRPISGQSHVHDTGFRSVTLKAGAALCTNRFNGWLDRLPRGICRIKGFVRFSGSDAVTLVQAVGRRRSARMVEAALLPAGGAELVLIGRDLDAAALQAGFEQCVAVTYAAAG